MRQVYEKSAVIDGRLDRGPMTMEIKTARCRFDYFNLLKILGAVNIALYHYRLYVLGALSLKRAVSGNVLPFLNSEMYFVISGILFAVVFEEKIANGSMTFDRFFLKRMARIYPVIAVTSIYMYLGNLLLHRYNDTMWNAGTPKVMELVYDILFAGKSIFKTSSTNNGVIWFISVLLFCYVIAYILTKAAHKYHAFLIFFLPVVLGVAIRYNGISTIFFNPSTSRGLISFFIGVIVGKLFRIIGGSTKGMPCLSCA